MERTYIVVGGTVFTSRKDAEEAAIAARER